MPFAIGGATQQGVVHKLENKNNQDAICIELNERFIAGVVCDGCAGTHNSLRNSYSNNEVAAKLFAMKIISAIRNTIEEKKNPDNIEFLNCVSEKLITDFSKLVDILCPNSEEEKEIFIFDFLMTTIVGFIITNERYIVFNCGDGIFSVNDKIQELQESGRYFSENILKICCPTKFSKIEDSSQLKICAEGNTTELKNIFLASDGFLPLLFNYSSVLIDFINRKNPKVRNNFDFLLQDLRSNLITQDKVKTHSKDWLEDDATFLLLSKIETDHKE